MDPTLERIAYPIAEGFVKIGIPRTACYRAIATGDLRTFKVGKRRMVTHLALVQYIAHLEAQSRRNAAA
jgi:hypothetical protein